MSPEEIQLTAEQKKLLAAVAEDANKPWSEVFWEALQIYRNTRKKPSAANLEMEEKARIEQFLQQLHRQGILVDFKPLPSQTETDIREPVTIQGPPLSETIIADRR